MNTIPGVVVAASNAQTNTGNGAEGLVVFLFLALAVFFLLRSMTKHLRKAQRMKIDEANAPDPLSGPDTKA